MMRYKIHIDAPLKGRSRQATITVTAGGRIVFTDHEDLSSATGRHRAARRLAANLKRKPGPIEKRLEKAWHEALTKQLVAQEQPQAPVSADYFIDEGRVCLRKETAVIPLSNFCARITEEVVVDDGAEQRALLAIDGALADGRPLGEIEVPASEFPRMDWPVKFWGARAVVSAGMNAKDHLRAAIQELSGDIPRAVVYGHTGFRQIGDVHAYLHRGGAIGPQGALPDIHVELPTALHPMVLPDPPEKKSLIAAVRASLRVFELAPARITSVVLGAAYRAPLGDCDFSNHLAGASGVFKTELGALTQQHFGAGFDSRNLPANWTSTGNATEGLAFLAKDMVVTVDDYAPQGQGAVGDVARLNREADRLFRNAGNRAARQRMWADGKLREPRPSRALLQSTGEEIPRGHSCRARVIITEVSKGDIDPERLSACQADAAAGLFAAAMAGYLKWLAGRYEAIRKEMRAELVRLREEQQANGQHRRTPANLAQLIVGWHYFLRFAVDAKAISAAEAGELKARVKAAVQEIGEAQQTHHRDAEPAYHFLRLLRACITSGRAHVASMKGENPDRHPEAWGWRYREIGAGENTREEWQPQGRRVGWLDGNNLYLDPESAHGEAQKLATEKGESLPVTSATLGKRLHEKKLLVAMDPGHQTVRRIIEGRRQRVLNFVSHGFFDVSESGPIGPCGPEPTQPLADGPLPWTASWTENGAPQEKRSTEAVHKPSENGHADRLDRFPEERGDAANEIHEGVL
jgi:hypothetical protein